MLAPGSQTAPLRAISDLCVRIGASASTVESGGNQKSESAHLRAIVAIDACNGARNSTPAGTTGLYARTGVSNITIESTFDLMRSHRGHHEHP